MQRPLILIFMGVAGSGKTTVGRRFAECTGAIFYEGDLYHPPANIAKMTQGVPLTDEDRAAWLRALRQIVEQARERRELAVITCSALKAQYRQQLQAGDHCVQFVYLDGPPALVQRRLQARRDHFMPPELLASQYDILEPPADAIRVNIDRSPEEIVDDLRRRLARELGDAGH